LFNEAIFYLFKIVVPKSILSHIVLFLSHPKIFNITWVVKSNSLLCNYLIYIVLMACLCIGLYLLSSLLRNGIIDDG